MRIRILSLVVLTAAIFSSCNRRETPVTGSYGERVVSGQVVMASEVVNSSPAGVEVSVVGTGMSVTLAADGRFTFVGVPANAELAFHRADGIDARFAASSSSFVVELSASGAKSSSSRRRGASQTREIEGLITDVSLDSLTVHDSHGDDVTVALTTSTVIRKGEQTLTADQLNKDDRVHVKASMVNNVLTAALVIVQHQEGDDDDDDNGTTMTANGLVKSVNEPDLVVQSQPKGDVTVKTDSSTIIKMQGQHISVGDIKPGWQVSCRGTRVGDHTLLAVQIEVRGKSKKS